MGAGSRGSQRDRHRWPRAGRGLRASPHAGPAASAARPALPGTPEPSQPTPRPGLRAPSTARPRLPVGSVSRAGPRLCPRGRERLRDEAGRDGATAPDPASEPATPPPPRAPWLRSPPCTASESQTQFGWKDLRDDRVQP